MRYWTDEEKKYLAEVTPGRSHKEITEMMGAKSMNDTVIELREDFEENSQEHIVIDAYLTVQNGSFAVGKQIRDIFWPRNLFVLSLKMYLPPASATSCAMVLRPPGTYHADPLRVSKSTVGR